MSFEGRLRRTLQSLETRTSQARKLVEVRDRRAETLALAKAVAIPEAEEIAERVEHFDILETMEQAERGMGIAGILTANIHHIFGERVSEGRWMWLGHRSYSATPVRHATLLSALRTACVEDAVHHAGTRQKGGGSFGDVVLHPNLYVITVNVLNLQKAEISEDALRTLSGPPAPMAQGQFSGQALEVRLDVRNGWTKVRSDDMAEEHTFTATSKEDIRTGIIDFLQYHRRGGFQTNGERSLTDVLQ